MTIRNRLRSAFNDLALAIIETTHDAGTIKLTASAAGLASWKSHSSRSRFVEAPRTVVP